MGFKLQPIENGLIFDFDDHNHPASVLGWTEESMQEDFLLEDVSYFGMVFSGRAKISCKSGTYYLSAGSYFSLSETFRVEGGSGAIITVPYYRCVTHVGGPIEKTGRLKYIDGCTDSLLIPPSVYGDPCLNALYFPSGVKQTLHDHPSVRIGLVYQGNGTCRLPDKTVALNPGQVFIIEPNMVHGFETSSTEELKILAFHPETDFGPKHNNHPMINRTIVDGVSAGKIDNIQTK